MSLLELAFSFFYVGLFTIGGGIVGLTLLQQTFVDTGIISLEDFYNMVAISESTPGPLGTNMATYIGYKFYGISGGIVATLSEALPSIIIILIIAHFLQKFNQNQYVKGALSFLRPITTGLILVPVIQICLHTLIVVPEEIRSIVTLQGLKEFFNWINIIAYSAFVFLLFKFKMHPIVVIGLGAIFGIVLL